MITYSQIGRKGNLGNQMFQIASTIGIAEKYGHDYFFPFWQFSRYFENQLPIAYMDESYKIIFEEKYNYYERKIDKCNYDIRGWLQSEKYFNTNKTKEIFKFKKEFTEELYNKYQFLFFKKTILISIRRGDFVNNPYFFQLSFKYYLLAITKNFPDWEDRNLIFTSDDLAYCKYHFSFLKNAFFLENLSAIEQMALCSQFDNFVISNSTFSWWMAWLGEKECSKIIRPIKNFRGEFGKQNNDSDYYPDRWISFDENLSQLENKYLMLNVKASIYSLFVNSRYRYLKLKKMSKNNVKMILSFLHVRKNIES
ncbi:MAG: alpha-1,2-fucosyltransferase [Flavobacteriaceae bacterium]|nr:alpha-1,2-fucosyltransferase [Flavobacteriaceae bacterium]